MNNLELDNIVRELLPLRPAKEKGKIKTQERLEREADAMITMITRLVGKPPRGFRISLLAGHENLVCVFAASSAVHWKYINEADEKWPVFWDMSARLSLSDDPPKKLTKAKVKEGDVVIIPPGQLAIPAGTLITPATKEDKQVQKIIDMLLLEDKGEQDAGQSTGSGDSWGASSDGEEDYTEGDSTTVAAYWEF